MVEQRGPTGPRWMGLAALAGAAAIWASTFVVIKGVLVDVGPIALAALRFLVALVVLLPLAWRAGYRLRDSLHPDFLAYGLTGVALFFGLQNVGLQFTTAGSAALLVALVPALTAGLARAVLGEALPGIRLLGVGAAVVGAAVVVASGAELGGGRAWLGNLLIIGAVVSWSVYTVQGRRVADAHSAVVAATGGIVAGLGLLLPAALIEAAVIGLPVLSVSALSAILYLGLVASALALLLWNAGVGRVDAAVAGATLNLVPVMGLAFAVAVGEAVSGLQLAGGALVVAGVVLATRDPRRVPASAAR